MPTKSRAATSATSQAAMTAASAARSIAFFLDLEDTNRVTLAVLMAASEELEHNAQFTARVRATYTMLPASKTRSGSTTSRKSDEARSLAATLKPIREVEGREINLAAPLDPYFLLDVYGAQQLRQALELFPLAKLKEGAEAVIERNPGTKPASKSSKTAIIDYIERYVAGTSSIQQ